MPTDRRQLGVGAGNRWDLTSSRSCEYSASGRYAITVAVFDELGIAQLKSETKPRDQRIGSRDARKGTGALSTCVIAIAVGESSRVDALATAGGNLRKSCRVAKRVAVLVEPKLP